MPESQNARTVRTFFFDAMAAWAARALPRLIAAILLLIFGFWFAGWLSRQVGKLVNRDTRIDATLHGVLTSVARYAILDSGVRRGPGHVSCVAGTGLIVRESRCCQ